MPAVANRTLAIPALGVGLGYRTELKEAILAHREQIDFLEIITDNYLAAPGAQAALRELCALFPVIPPGVDLSIGSLMPLDQPYLQGIKRISDLTGSPYYSEHLCMTRVPGRDIGHLAPLWFTEELLQHVTQRVLTLQDFLGKPLILENVTYMLEIPQSTMSQAEFFQHLVEATGCGVLLDITNVFINATNHHFDFLFRLTSSQKGNPSCERLPKRVLFRYQRKQGAELACTLTHGTRFVTISMTTACCGPKMPCSIQWMR